MRLFNGRRRTARLEAAHSDRQAGRSALVVIQTSNDHLDGLNARAQALRAQDGILAGEHAVVLAGRPYGLRAGDEIVLRAASVHPQLGAVRSGTRGRVVDVAEDEHATVALADSREASWDRGQLEAASVRLAYVSHTWPAQGQTVDRAHVIAGDHADREDRLARLAERLGRSEPEVPSIAVALAHEHQVQRELDRESTSSPRRSDNDDGDGPRRRAPDQREQRDQARARLQRARVERDQAAAALEHARVERDQAARVMATMPRDPDVAHAVADAQYAAGQAQFAAAQVARLTGQLGELGRFQRLGERGRTLRAQLAATRDREQRAADRQRRLEQEADRRQAQLDHQRQAWEVQQPGAPQRDRSAQTAYAQADDRHQAAEQTYELTLTHGLLAASAVAPPGARRWPRRPGDPLEPELDRPAPRIDRGREGPSLGL
ncbi:MAG: hypothetical protein ACR2NR_07745 [Solirubrobacteraceae bacterium]